MRTLLACLALLILAAPVAAQTREPRARQTLLELAGVLGQSHALRQACEGEGDQFWRARMIRLIDVEAVDPEFVRRLKAAFNAAFEATREDFPGCGPATRAAEAEAAARGRALSRGLSRSGAAPVEAPDSMAGTPAPR